jgi:hypothetical protein
MSDSIRAAMREMKAVDDAAAENARLQTLADEAAAHADAHETVIERQDARRAGLVTGSAPERFKAQTDWSVPEILEHRRGGTAPETDAYRAYVRRVHEAAGHETPGERPTGEAMSVADHLDRIQRH